MSDAVQVGEAHPQASPGRARAQKRQDEVRLRERLRAELESIESQPRFRVYKSYAKALREEVWQQRAEVQNRLRNDTIALEEAERQSLDAPDRMRLLRILVLIGASLLLVVSIFVVQDFRGFYWEFFPTLRNQRIALALVAIGGLVLCIGAARGLRAQQTMREKLQQNVAAANRRWEATIHTAAEELYTLAVNRQLGPKGILAFPTDTPRLVELDSSTVVPSATLEYLRAFIAGHESSAIGIAGPRGSGKSTLLNALRLDARDGRAAVMLSAPVKYSAGEFSRRLLVQVASKIRDEYGGEHRAGTTAIRGLRLYMARALIAMLAIAVGIAFVVVDLRWQPDFSSTFGWLGATGLVVALCGLSGMVYALAHRWPGQRLAHEARSARLAAEALEWLSYDVQHAQRSKNQAKSVGGFFQLEDEDTLTLSRREASHVDIAAHLRELLESFVGERGPDSRFLIIVDELDKISQVPDLVDAVNDLKDLFHIRGVHFLVSVSLDALASFEQRGLPSRDAFDSSFDTIIGVSPLSVDESLGVLASRAAGLPPFVGLFCHAWSGGLPRDLLRHARRCVELHRASGGPLPLVDLMARVVATDLNASVEALLRSDAGLADEALLLQLRQHLSDLRQSAKGEWQAMAGADVSGHAATVARDVARLGGAFLQYLRRRTNADSWQIPDQPMKEVAEAVALAMSRRGDTPPLRQEALERALHRCAE